MLGVGGPAHAFDPNGGWDLLPVLIAIVGLLLLKVIFRVRITPIVVLVAVLLAPLYRAAADAAGFPRTVLITVVVAAYLAAASPFRRAFRARPPNV
jgi:hypothetical protein